MSLGAIPLKFRVCSIKDCGREILARGYCQRHYAKARRAGELGGRGGAAPQVVFRVWVSEELEDALVNTQRVTGKSYSALIREALERFLEMPPKSAAPATSP